MATGSEDVQPVKLGGRKAIDPEAAAKEQEAYAARIKKATPLDGLKKPQPVGIVPHPTMPDFAALKNQRSEQVSQRRGDSSIPGAPTGGVVPRPPGSPAVRPETLAAIQNAQEQGAKLKEEVAEEEGEKLDDAQFDEELRKVLGETPINKTERILRNPERRKDIESRCTPPISIREMLTKGFVTQSIPILPGEFEITLRSLIPDESTFLKEVSNDEKVRVESYLVEKYSLGQLAFALVAINGETLPPCTNQDGEIDKKAFLKRLKRVMKMSSYIIADIALQAEWFDYRCRLALNPKLLGNG